MRAALRGAKLVVFPEAFVGGYPKGLDFGVRVGMRTPPGANSSASTTTARSRCPARSSRGSARSRRPTTSISSPASSSATPGTLYCTVLFFGPDGRLLGKHRKLMPTAAERLIWGFGDGSTLPVLDTPLGKLGAVICWENYMPMLRMAMYAKGIELYCAPTADDRETWISTMRHVALEGRCFVLSACQFARRSDYPADYPIEGNPAARCDHHARRKLHHRAARPGAGRARLRRRYDPDRRDRSGRHRARQIRLRRRRPLRPARRVPAQRQRDARRRRCRRMLRRWEGRA